MTKNEADVIVATFSREFGDFSYVKGKGLWMRETQDQALLLIGYQPSKTGMIFYLNFGVYFYGIVPVKNPPKIADWHLFARYERFFKSTVPEYNQLFSVEQHMHDSLEKRCSQIASFSNENIIPKLRIFGNFQEMRERLTAAGTDVFEPFWAQNISKAQIAAHILGV